MRTTAESTNRVGSVAMGLVPQFGSCSASEYGDSLSVLDLDSGYLEDEIVMGRAQRRIFSALKDIEARSPFAWRSIHSDSDNAFIIGYFYDHTKQCHCVFTRSRPYWGGPH